MAPTAGRPRAPRRARRSPLGIGLSSWLLSSDVLASYGTAASAARRLPAEMMAVSGDLRATASGSRFLIGAGLALALPLLRRDRRCRSSASVTGLGVVVGFAIVWASRRTRQPTRDRRRVPGGLHRGSSTAIRAIPGSGCRRLGASASTINFAHRCAWPVHASPSSARRSRWPSSCSFAAARALNARPRYFTRGSGFLSVKYANDFDSAPMIGSGPHDAAPPSAPLPARRRRRRPKRHSRDRRSSRRCPSRSRARARVVLRERIGERVFDGSIVIVASGVHRDVARRSSCRRPWRRDRRRTSRRRALRRC